MRATERLTPVPPTKKVKSVTQNKCTSLKIPEQEKTFAVKN